ncbi:MAG TPA: ATP-binding protein [Chloroflexota bacterium]|nr:ATP-binding protein [Chloroflexota bacterium]
MTTLRIPHLWPRRLRWRLIVSFALTVALLQAVLTIGERLLVQQALVQSITSSLESTVQAGFAGQLVVQGTGRIVVSNDGAISAYKQGMAALQQAQQGIVADKGSAFKQAVLALAEARQDFSSMSAYTGTTGDLKQGDMLLQAAQLAITSWDGTPLSLKQVRALVLAAQKAFGAVAMPASGEQPGVTPLMSVTRAVDVTGHLGDIATALALPDQPVMMLDTRGRILAQAGTLAGDRKRVQPLAPAVLQSLLAVAIPRVEKVTGPWTTQVTTPDGPYLLLLWPANEPVLQMSISKQVMAPVLEALKGNPKALGNPALQTTLKSLQSSSANLVVLIAHRLSETQQTVQTVTAISIGGAALVIALAALLSLLVVGRALRPLAAITHGAERLAQGDYHHRLALDVGADEVGRLATAFNRMAAAIATAFATQRRFVADASHELRTPLTALRGYTDVLLMGVHEDRATAGRVLHAMQEDLGRMSRLVEDLLTLARLDGGAPLRMASILVADLLGAAAYEGQAIARGRLRIVVEPVVPELMTWGDRDRMRQVLANVVANACVYCPPGSTVQLRAWQQQHEVVIQVQDNGPGIAPADLARLGERFYRGDAARSRLTGGTGLGLAIARAIVEAHGGTLSIASDLGMGTVVTVRLPLGAGGRVNPM